MVESQSPDLRRARRARWPATSRSVEIALRELRSSHPTSRSCSAAPAVGGSLPRERGGMRVLERIDESVEAVEDLLATASLGRARIDFPRMSTPRDRDRRRRLHRLARRRRAARRRLRGDRDRRPLLGRRRAGSPTRRSCASSTSSTAPRWRRSSTRSSRARSSTSRRRRAWSSRSRIPGRDCEVNVQGTLNVRRGGRQLRRARRLHLDRRRAVRGRRADADAARTAFPAPLSPYGASKWAAEAYVKTWSLSSGIPHAVCRLGNVYGPRQSPHGEAGVVAIFAQHLYTDSAPEALRPRQADARLRVRRRRRQRAAGRVGKCGHLQHRHRRRDRRDDRLERAAASVAGSAASSRELADLRPGELKHSRLDISRAERELGWRAAGADRGGAAADLRGAGGGIHQPIGVSSVHSSARRGCRARRARR